jgi:hypothetical protein
MITPAPVAAPPAANGTCGTCRAPVVWASTVSGSTMPIDPGIDAAGNVAVTPGNPPRVRYLKTSEEPGAAEYPMLPHWATCPDAKQHRRPRDRAAAAGAFQQPADGTHRPPVTGPAGEIAAQVTQIMAAAMRNHPRSLQAAPGPSELGTPCGRRLAYKVLDWARPNDDRDQWLSTIGTAVHSWQADTFEAENRRLGRARYLIEQRVHLPEGISGSCDLFDTDDPQTVLDWKITGLDRIKKYARSGPGDQYRIQAHLYGLGWLLAGYQPKRVAIVFLPRGGLLAGLHVWTEPFDPQVAVDAIKRYRTTVLALAHLDPERNPGRWAMFPTADAFCTWCPYFLPGSTDLGKGCPGHHPA